MVQMLYCPFKSFFISIFIPYRTLDGDELTMMSMKNVKIKWAVKYFNPFCPSTTTSLSGWCVYLCLWIQWTRELFSHWQNWLYWFTFPHPKNSRAKKKMWVRMAEWEIQRFHRIVGSIGWKGVMRCLSCRHHHHHCWHRQKCDAPQSVSQICDPFSIWFAIQSRFDQNRKNVCLCARFSIFIQFINSHDSVIVLKLKCITLFPKNLAANLILRS